MTLGKLRWLSTECFAVRLLSWVWLFATPWTAACQAPLSFTISWSLCKLMSIESVMPSNHLIFCCPLLLLLSIPASGSFPVSWLFTSGGQKYWSSASPSVLPMNIQGWFPLRLTCLISWQSKVLSRVFSNTTTQKNQFFFAQPSLWSNSHIVYDYWKNCSFYNLDLCWQSASLFFKTLLGLS